MEFFRIIDINTTEDSLQKNIILSKIENITSQIFVLENINDRKAFTGGVWGEFILTLDLIKGGVRFALEDCPNAFQWTITTGYPPSRESIVIHLTINRQRKQQEFIDEIEEFLDDHVESLKSYLK